MDSIYFGVIRDSPKWDGVTYIWGHQRTIVSRMGRFRMYAIAEGKNRWDKLLDEFTPFLIHQYQRQTQVPVDYYRAFTSPFPNINWNGKWCNVRDREHADIGSIIHWHGHDPAGTSGRIDVMVLRKRIMERSNKLQEKIEGQSARGLD